MDRCRFDNLTRLLGATRDRRSAVKSLAGAGAAMLALARADLGLAQDDDVLVEGCRVPGEECKHNRQCCSNRCHRRRRRKKGGDNRKRRRDGECKCLKQGRRCSKDAACCKGRCHPTERRCRCVPRAELCGKNEDCCDGRVCRDDGTGSKVCLGS
jgi:hypothetical protein